MSDRQDQAIQEALGTENRFIKKRIEALKKQYQPWLEVHKEISEFIAVGRGRFPEKGYQPYEKPKREYKVINPVATRALNIAGAGMHGGLSSPARPWFQLQLADEDMNRFGQFRNWLDMAEKRLYMVFKASNFYHYIHSVYEEEFAFGNGCTIIDEHPRQIVHFHPMTTGDYVFMVNHDGMCHTMAREYQMQAIQMVGAFGMENISERVKNQLQNNPYKFMPIYHIIEPNVGAQTDKIDTANMPFRSIYMEKNAEQNQKLAVGGYNEMPVVVPRWWALGGEAYGWGPGLWALGLCKSIQSFEKTSFKIVEKLAKPPLAVPPSFKDRALDLTAGAKNVVSDEEHKTGTAKLYPIYDVDPNGITILDGKIQRIEQMVQELFYVDLFLMLQQDKVGQMTATEVLRREEEKMLLLGPTIERQIHELLDPIIKRVFNICLRREIIPPPPPELAEADYKIEYISVLAQSQKLVMARSLESYITQTERVAAIDPVVGMYKTDWAEYLHEWADLVGLPERIQRDNDEVEQIRQAQIEAQQQEQAQMAQAQDAQNLKTLSEASTGDSNMLEEMQRDL